MARRLQQFQLDLLEVRAARRQAAGASSDSERALLLWEQRELERHEAFERRVRRTEGLRRDGFSGRAGHELGRKNEERLRVAILRLTPGEDAGPHAIPWILGCRPATPVEDANGIDVVVATDVGDLWLQAKSSRSGILKFLAKRRKLGRTEPVACVLVEEDTEILRTRTRWALVSLRERALVTLATQERIAS